MKNIIAIITWLAIWVALWICALGYFYNAIEINNKLDIATNWIIDINKRLDEWFYIPNN